VEEQQQQQQHFVHEEAKQVTPPKPASAGSNRSSLAANAGAVKTPTLQISPPISKQPSRAEIPEPKAAPAPSRAEILAEKQAEIDAFKAVIFYALIGKEGYPVLF
jgi:hypothetical protein